VFCFKHTETPDGTLVNQFPNLHHSLRYYLAGTGTTVRRIVGWYQLGLSADEIAHQFPHLGLAQIYAALACYHANREEIDADIAQEEAENERICKEYQATKQP